MPERRKLFEWCGGKLIADAGDGGVEKASMAGRLVIILSVRSMIF